MNSETTENDTSSILFTYIGKNHKWLAELKVCPSRLWLGWVADIIHRSIQYKFLKMQFS